MTLSLGDQQAQVADRKLDARVKSGPRIAYTNTFVNQDIESKLFKENLQLCKLMINDKCCSELRGKSKWWIGNRICYWSRDLSTRACSNNFNTNSVLNWAMTYQDLKENLQTLKTIVSSQSCFKGRDFGNIGIFTELSHNIVFRAHRFGGNPWYETIP